MFLDEIRYHPERDGIATPELIRKAKAVGFRIKKMSSKVGNVFLLVDPSGDYRFYDAKWSMGQAWQVAAKFSNCIEQHYNELKQAD